MGLHAIDFLSDQPKNFIFQKTSNKTNLGGILSLVYLIVFLIIAISYLVFYFIKDNYSIEYLQHEKIISKEEHKKYLYDPKYNPKFNFNFYLFEENKEGRYCKQDFQLYDRTHGDDNPLKNYSGSFDKTVQSFDFYIVYDCLDKNNTNFDFDRTYALSNEVKLAFWYHGYILDHQNKSSPFYINTESIYSYTVPFKYDYPLQYRYKWNIIKYKEEKGFFSIFDGFQEKNEDYGKEVGISIKVLETHNLANEYGKQDLYLDYSNSKTNETHLYKILGEIKFYIDYNHYEEYKRTAKSFWDTVANICSLSLSVFNGFSLVFGKIYSNNFDNYKILEKLLFNVNPKDDLKVKKTKEIELISDLNKTYSLIDKTVKEQNIIVKNDETEKLDDSNNENNKEYNCKNVIMPKLRFFDFIFNNIYCSKHCKTNRQEIINKCNEIILKYYSIENVLYNQLMLEILFKDYKWNDPGLNGLDNNELIIQLKNLVNSYNNT